MINPMKLMQMKSLWDRFTQNHPKFPRFLAALNQKGFREGTILECKVITPEGEELTTNLRIQADDIALFRELKDLMQQH